MVDEHERISSKIVPKGSALLEPSLPKENLVGVIMDVDNGPKKSSRGRLSFPLVGWRAEVVPASNRVSLKVAEQERLIRMALATRDAKYMLLPDSMARYCWDLITALTTIVLVWRVPYAMAFGDDVYAWIIFNKCSDAIYMLDIIVNFRTGFTVDTDVVLDSKRVAVRYLRGWFIVDLVGSIPFELFTGQSSGYERKAIKASVKYLKIPKLLRLGRLIKFVQKYLKYAYALQIFVCYMSIIHWVACLWTSRYLNLDLYPDVFLAYGESLYAAVMLLINVSTISMDPGDHFVCSLLVVLGFFFHTLTFASFTAAVVGSTSREVQYQDKVRMVMSDLKALQIPVELRKATKAYYETLWRMKNTSDRYEKGIYEDEDLSPALRSEIALHIHRQLVATVPLFQGCTDVCLASVVMKLRTHLYMRGDVIFHLGDPANNMMIISRGKVKVISPDNDTLLAVLKQGCFFGEIGLLRNMTRSCTVTAATFCELKSLHRKDAEEIFDLYPHIYDRLFAESEKRRQDTRLKAKLYNVKVLDNAHAVDVSSIDTVKDPDENGTSERFMVGGLSEQEQASRANSTRSDSISPMKPPRINRRSSASSVEDPNAVRGGVKQATADNSMISEDGSSSGTSTNLRKLIRGNSGLSDDSHKSRRLSKLVRVPSIQSEDNSVINGELDRLTTTIDDMQHLMDTLKAAQTNLARVQERRQSLHMALGGGGATSQGHTPSVVEALNRTMSIASQLQPLSVERTSTYHDRQY